MAARFRPRRHVTLRATSLLTMRQSRRHRDAGSAYLAMPTGPCASGYPSSNFKLREPLQADIRFRPAGGAGRRSVEVSASPDTWRSTGPYAL